MSCHYKFFFVIKYNFSTTNNIKKYFTSFSKKSKIYSIRAILLFMDEGQI